MRDEIGLGGGKKSGSELISTLRASQRMREMKVLAPGRDLVAREGVYA